MEADLCKKKEWGFKNISNKITSIKGKKKEDGTSEKTDDETENQLHWKKEK